MDPFHRLYLVNLTLDRPMNLTPWTRCDMQNVVQWSLDVDVANLYAEALLYLNPGTIISMFII